MRNIEWFYSPRRKAYLLMEDDEEIFHCNESYKKELNATTTMNIIDVEAELANEMGNETNLDSTWILSAINLLKNW